MNKKHSLSITVVINQIEKKYGKGAIMRLSSQVLRKNMDIFSTGSLNFDIITGIGGYPLGRIVEIYGPESSGKTTLGLHAIAEVQKKFKTAAFIDVEHALDINYAKNLGIILEDFLISQPDSAEQALEITTILSQSGTVKLIVIDSVAALVPQDEIDGDMQNIQIGLQARLMSKCLRKLAMTISRNNVSVMFINQVRMKVGILFGTPETTTGGKALKFYASLRIEIRKISSIKKGYEIIGNRTKIKIVKNKLSAPFKEIELDILYGSGISKEGELLDLGIKSNIIKKNGPWLSFQEELLGQGKEYARQNLIINKVLAKHLYKSIYNIISYKMNKSIKKKFKYLI